MNAFPELRDVKTHFPVEHGLVFRRRVGGGASRGVHRARIGVSLRP
jgi:hypothetical protein